MTRTRRLIALEKTARARANNATGSEEIRLHARWSRIVTALIDSQIGR